MPAGCGRCPAGPRTVGLENQATRRFGQLSGGQQQRLALLTALIHEPPLALLDEPTTGLDPKSRRELWDRIGGMVGRGTGVVLTTHSMEEAAKLASRLVILHRSQVRASGTVEQLLAQFGGSPAVKKIAHGQPTLEDVFLAITGGEEE